MSQFARLLDQHRDLIVERWAGMVAVRLGLDETRRPQLINDMPEVLDELVLVLSDASRTWCASGGRAHARQRVGLGIDIGGLSEEFGMMGESIIEVFAEQGHSLEPEALVILMRFLSHCSAESINEFAQLTAGEMKRQSAQHFSFVAHELRTPLQAAKLAVMLLEEPGNEERAKARLKSSLDRLSNLIDNTLVSARLTAEPIPAKGVVRMAHIIEDALDQCGELASTQGIVLEVESEDFEFEGDRKLMMSALTNLVVNGIKFSKRAGCVLIKAAVKDERVHIEVHDSCGGLPDGAAAKMFQSFTQAGSDRSGFGLGLLIVRQAIEAHGGRVRVLDDPGRGCRMLMELPRFHSRDRKPG